ncbi:hypothetical protein [Natronorarus salvus]|uniref:hypothetical protein n=1 Tax=Natronorarus salvus TaxID=3117733 RepID=UPI002F26DA52
MSSAVGLLFAVLRANVRVILAVFVLSQFARIVDGVRREVRQRQADMIDIPIHNVQDEGQM